MSAKEKSRRYTRVELPNGMLVAWEHYGIRKVSRVQVLALGGLFIATPAPPPVGDVIQLIFEVPGGDVRARAMIRDSQPGKGMGIEFTGMNTEARARLNQLMKVLSRDVGDRPSRQIKSSPLRKQE
ncbi:MAG: hypothetical protein JWN92_158 [Candidatus Acidoferrum typicum]|nr:hypothetical protein [Candidatus Acidoferrum typicum]